MNSVAKVYHLVRHLGVRLLWLRGRVYLDDALGRTRKQYPHRRWEDIDLHNVCQFGAPANPKSYAAFKRKQNPPFFFPLGAPPQISPSLHKGTALRQPSLGERLELLRQDRCVYFFRTPAPSPIDWHVNPFDGKRAAADRLWCDISDFDPTQGDPRTLWEPSRAAWAFDLARARPCGHDVAAGDLFWRWLDSWMEANPPFWGVQWKSGQEAAVRFIALCFGFWSLATDSATSDGRWIQFARLAWASGYRIRRHIRYAVSQKNNHALSEAGGLLLISQLFPEFRDAAEWDRTGRRIFARELVRQVYGDGSYVQHSMNYHRVMLHLALLTVRLAELAGKRFPPEVYRSLDRAEEFLFQMIDPPSGRAPNYGNNDGALVLPLSECNFTDYRPVSQAVRYLVHKKRRFESGPWDEALLWLFGTDALAEPLADQDAPASSAFEHGGYYTLRGEKSWAMVRCHTYKDRPGQCDSMHMDLFMSGRNVAQDAGTFQYYVPERPELEYYFKSTAAHNTVEVDAADPCELVSRFLWLPWPRAGKRRFTRDAEGSVIFEGERLDYDRRPWRIRHRRAIVMLPGDAWLIADDLLGRKPHRATLRWHLMDAPYRVDDTKRTIVLDPDGAAVALAVASFPYGPCSFGVARGRDDPGNVQGFISPYYAERLPVPVFETHFEGTLPLRIVTVVAPGATVTVEVVDARGRSQQCTVNVADDTWCVRLARPDRSAPRIVERVQNS